MLKWLKTPPTPTTGFTLAEVLIALALLGVIATFSIPKVLQTVHDNQRLTIAKETMSLLSDACFKLKMNNGGKVLPEASFEDLKPYINYLRTTSTGSLDGSPANSIHQWALPLQ